MTRSGCRAIIFFLHGRRDVSADLFFLEGFGRVIAEAAYADDFFSQTESKKNFRDAGGDGDDPLRRTLYLSFPSQFVLKDGSEGKTCKEQEKGDRKEQGPLTASFRPRQETAKAHKPNPDSAKTFYPIRESHVFYPFKRFATDHDGV
jgi:hypothetical protein